MKVYYSYFCSDYMDCLDFLEGCTKYSSLEEFLETVCGSCPDCVVSEISYEEYLELHATKKETT